MKLKVSEIINNLTTLPERLGISKEREQELKDIILELMKSAMIEQSITGKPIDVVGKYKYLAEKSNNLEEYTQLLHLFIFTSARFGVLNSELK